MIILCPKCKKTFNPETEFARCGPVGHEPAVKIDVHLSDAILDRKDKAPKSKEIQSDFAWLDDEGFGRRHVR